MLMSIKTHIILTLLLFFGGFAAIVITGQSLYMLVVGLGFLSALGLGLRAVITTLFEKKSKSK